MKRVALIICFAILTIILLANPTGKVFACAAGFTTNPNPIIANQAASFTIPISQYGRAEDPSKWTVEFYCSGGPTDIKSGSEIQINNGAITVNIIASSCAVNPTTAPEGRLFVVRWKGTNPGEVCRDNYYTVDTPSSGQYCNISLSTNAPSVNDTITVTANNTGDKPLSLRLNPHGGGSGQTTTTLKDPVDPHSTWSQTIGPFGVNDYDVFMTEGGLHAVLCPTAFKVSEYGGEIPGGQTAQPQDVCSFVESSKQPECQACTAKSGVWTAVGCITTDPNNLLGTILRVGLGLAGGIAFLLILFGGLQIMTSAGNPERLNAGRELITSAIIGLILVLFSIFLLQFIGVNIIGIPGFGSNAGPQDWPNAPWH